MESKFYRQMQRSSLERLSVGLIGGVTGRHNGYPEWAFTRLPSVPPGKSRDKTSKWAPIYLLQILHNSSLILHSTTLCHVVWADFSVVNPLKPELNPICYLLALLGDHHFIHVSRIRIKLLTFRLLMSYIYEAPILDVSRSHTTTQHSR